MIAIEESMARNCWIRSRPPIPGILRSTSTKSGLRSRAIATASSPLDALLASQLRCTRARHNRLRKTSSSSTTRTSGLSSNGGIHIVARGVQGQIELRCRALSRRRLERQISAQAFGERPYQKRPQPHTFSWFLGREERLGNPAKYVLWHTLAAIGDRKHDLRTAALGADDNLSIRNIGV